MTICLPLLLTIRVSDGRNVVYRACQRPPSLRPLIAALCPLLGRPRFCARYHRLLAVNVVAPPATKLIQPQNGAALNLPPVLAWRPVPGAEYYNVQLWALPRGGRPVKILSTWPTTNRLQVVISWVYEGNRHQLTRGRYRWYVWPGIGPIVRARYGGLIGSSTFTIVS